MKLAISGAASVTAVRVVQAAAEAGHDVVASTASRDHSGIKAARLAELPGVVTGVAAEDGGLTRWLGEVRPDVFVHHHHWMQAFRSADYARDRAEAVVIAPMRSLVQTLHSAGCRGIVHTGTFFENDARTPYAESKIAVWDALQRVCAEVGLPLAKVMVPSAIDPLENPDRLVPTLIGLAHRGGEMHIRTPNSRSDFLPARDLAQVYLQAAEGLLAGQGRVYAPSGKVCSIRAWVTEVNEVLVRTRLGLAPARMTFGDQTGPSFFNDEPRSVDWAAAWDHYAAGVSASALGGA